VTSTQAKSDSRNETNDLETLSPFADADLQPSSGTSSEGTATFTIRPGSLQINVSVKGVVPPGMHGIHIHEFGDCSKNDASSAGGHFNPTNINHGMPNSNESHLGDLGNIEISDNGRGSLRLILQNSFYDIESIGGWSAILGKSLVLHEGEDDLRTNPSGKSGNRIACGIIKEFNKSK
jgi:Cu-Zn family superoxide dismutase